MKLLTKLKLLTKELGELNKLITFYDVISLFMTFFGYFMGVQLGMDAKRGVVVLAAIMIANFSSFRKGYVSGVYDLHPDLLKKEMKEREEGN